MSTQQDDPYKDPHAERESQKYEFPVPSREAVLGVLEEAGVPKSFSQLCEALGVSGERDETAFARRLRAMERDGQLLKNRSGRFGVVSRMDLVCGRVVGHPDGFGFVIPDAGGEDLFLSPRDMRQVLHGDRVMARVTGVDRRGRRQGAIVEVLEHRNQQVVGRLIVENSLQLVVPDDKRISQDILVPAGEAGSAQPGQIVVAEIVTQPNRRTQPVGRVVEVLGDHMAPGMEIEIALRKYDLPYIWPDEVESGAARLPREVPEADKQGRQDLRNLPLVTIDGADARDFDDAVYCEANGNGYRLVVCIADVSHYVTPGSELDREAYLRGNSVYFPVRVIPMLPEALSNGLCSLNPEVDRLCMACDMDIGPRGKIRDYRFYPAVMRSRARLTYTQAAAMLVDGDTQLRDRHGHVIQSLDNLYQLFKVLHRARDQRGTVDLDLPETRILYDDQRRIERIVPSVRNDAHRLIEECMLAANVCAAEFLSRHEVPVLYRVHEGPSADKLEDLKRFLAELGLRLTGGNEPGPADYGKLISQLEGRPDRHLVQTVLLRSLSQAVYSPDNKGHFALGYPNYTHFTSPIRRYPDLLVHRAIKAVLDKKKIRRDEDTHKFVLAQGEHCSTTERRADEATRDVIDWLKAEYMMEHVGDVFDGVISGVTSFGLFVELKEIYVEGLVHITGLGNDYYHFDPVHHRLTGERSGQVYRLGDGIRVKVVRVNLDDARIDFELDAVAPAAGVRRKPGKNRKPAGDRKPGRQTKSGKGGKGKTRPRRRKK